MKAENIYLRILEFEDVSRTQVWINEDEIGEIMGYLPQPLIQQQDWFRKIAHDQSKYIFAICRVSDHEHIGNVALGNIDWLHRHAMLSVFIAVPECRKHGYGREAVELLLRFGFLRLNLHKIFLRTSAEYPGALRFYEKLGFVHEGVLRKHEFKYGRYRDKHLFGMLREEYPVDSPQFADVESTSGE